MEFLAGLYTLLLVAICLLQALLLHRTGKPAARQDDEALKEWLHQQLEAQARVLEEIFFWYGKDDKVLPWMINQVQGPALQAALEVHKVPYIMKVFESAPHSIGVGYTTDAEGWLTDAVAFWEQQTAA